MQNDHPCDIQEGYISDGRRFPTMEMEYTLDLYLILNSNENLGYFSSSVTWFG